MKKDCEKKVFEWTNNGKAFRLEIHYKAELVHYSRLYGPCQVQHFIDKSIVLYDAEVAAYVDGVWVDSIGERSFWKVMDLPEHPGYQGIKGLRVGFPAMYGDAIQKLLDEAIAEGTPAEVAEFLAKEEAEEQARRNAETVEDCRKIIAAFEAQGVKPETRKEAKRIMVEFNNVNNEGGEGYVPYVYSREDYDWAVNELSRLEK